MADTAFDFAFSIRLAHTARQWDGAVVRQHAAVQRIQLGVVDVWVEHAFAEIIEDDDSCGAAQPAKGFLMQLRPDLGA